MSPVYIVALVVIMAIVIGLIIAIINTTIKPKKIDAVPKLIKQGKTQNAVKICKSIISKDPKNYLAHFYLGKTYIADGKPELAIMEYKLVNENALFGHGIDEVAFRSEFRDLLLNANQQNDALRECLLLTKIDPKNAQNFYEAGHIYTTNNRYDLALGYMQKTVQLDKRHAKAHAELGLMMYRTKQFSEAKKEIDTALKLSPDTYSSYYYLGKILKDAKDLPGAIKAFEKAQRDPEFKLKAIIERGSCFMIANRLDNAIPDFMRAIDLDKEGTMSETIYARYFLASCYEQIRQIDKAIEQWEFIFRRNKGFRDVAQKLSEYKDLQSNDFMKDYLTANDEEFSLICKNLTEKTLNLQVITVEKKKYGCNLSAVDKRFDGMLGVKKHVMMLRFYREPNPVDEPDLHEVVDLLKTQGAVKGYLFSSSGFNNMAKRFAEGRPIELIEKQKLEQLLTKAGSKN
ncbi:MAG: tetratricopeptide repeat protein [Treponema sp.]|nr:tetratricopeptide repeat protein [Treponema sp.]